MGMVHAFLLHYKIIITYMLLMLIIIVKKLFVSFNNEQIDQ